MKDEELLVYNASELEEGKIYSDFGRGVYVKVTNTEDNKAEVKGLEYFPGNNEYTVEGDIEFEKLPEEDYFGTNYLEDPAKGAYDLLTRKNDRKTVKMLLDDKTNNDNHPSIQTDFLVEYIIETLKENTKD